MFEFEPTAADDDLFPDGEYDAIVKRATPRVSKKKPDGTGGNNMLELIVTVFGPDRRKADVFDYLVDTENGRWKIRNFCTSGGIHYDGRIDEASLPDTNIRVLLSKEKASGGYPAKNRINDYVLRTNDAPAGAGVSAGNGFVVEDSDVPFAVLLVPFLGVLLSRLVA